MIFEEVLLLVSFGLLLAVTLGGTIGVFWARSSKKAVDTAIDDVESRMASYELTSNLANEEFAEYLDQKISTVERAAEKRMPKRIVVADAATTPEAQTADCSTQTAELPSVKVNLPTQSVSLPCVIQVKPIEVRSTSLRFIGDHPLI